MLIAIISWVVLGAIAGWIATMVMRVDSQYGWLGNIVIGILGGLIGGLIVRLFGGTGVTGFNLWGLLVSVLGAIVLLWLVGIYRGNRRTF